MSAVTTSWSIGRRQASTAARSFASVAEAHLDDVYRYLVYFTRDTAVAEDLTGETFEKALRSWHRFDERRGSARTWLCQIARSAALDHFRADERRRRRETAHALSQGDELDPPGPSEGLSPELDEAVRGLSAGEREVLVLRVVLELDGQTVAEVLGISETACSTRLSRALRKLEERVEVNV